MSIKISRACAGAPGDGRRFGPGAALNEARYTAFCKAQENLPASDRGSPCYRAAAQRGSAAGLKKRGGLLKERRGYADIAYMAPRQRAREAGVPGANATSMIERIEQGRAGEVEVATRLRRLGASYRVIHDLVLPTGGDADHIVVGPSGVFVIETKSYNGKVQLLEDSIVIDGFRPRRDLMSQVRRSAKMVKGILATLADYRGWVQPVICFGRSRLERSRFVSGVLLTNPEQLCYLIRHWRSPGLSEDSIEAAFDALASRSREKATIG